MRKIKNHWVHKEGYDCFGCSPDNPLGVKMEFYEDGDDIVCFWKPQAHYQGWIDTLHGGIQATLIDVRWLSFMLIFTILWKNSAQRARPSISPGVRRKRARWASPIVNAKTRSCCSERGHALDAERPAHHHQHHGQHIVMRFIYLSVALLHSSDAIF